MQVHNPLTRRINLTLPGLPDLPSPSSRGYASSSLPPSPTTTTTTTSSTSISRIKAYNFDIDRKGKPLAVLTLYANGDHSPSTPTFVEGQPIKGQLKLDLEKAENFLNINIRVQGKLSMVTGPTESDQVIFLDIVHPLWSQSVGDPRHTATSFTSWSPDPFRAMMDPFNGKLPEGVYVWHFTIELPKYVVVPVGSDRPQTFKLPPSFVEKNVGATIVYDVTAKLTTNSLLRTTHRTTAKYDFIPSTRPPPFLPMRAAAYRDGVPLPPPSIDEEGWHASKPAQFTGLLFKNKVVYLDCIATSLLVLKLVYARGTVIPLFLEISGQDTQAVALLSSPLAVFCRLRRTIKFHNNGKRLGDKQQWKDGFSHSQVATWRKVEDRQRTSDNSKKRACLQGELLLSNTLKPTSALAYFEIKYSVVLLPFAITGFDAEGKTELIKEPVEIVTGTGYAPGRRSTRMSTPSSLASSDISSPIPEVPVRREVRDRGFI
ncbi:hypothetical protein CPB83DRAFT_853046 [Crepidotus variabilis]|uniref:Arrestin-like N-terminal domain-containing protein n=1 Tax=Crepidotus variabilis TaxID=179855 RepID=A0A9P6EGR9_9AGAR|nr:hypothetical protein CPB83DRAFT_853046 [Crepidotus variabilis]